MCHMSDISDNSLCFTNGCTHSIGGSACGCLNGTAGDGPESRRATKHAYVRCVRDRGLKSLECVLVGFQNVVIRKREGCVLLRNSAGICSQTRTVVQQVYGRVSPNIEEHNSNSAAGRLSCGRLPTRRWHPAQRRPAQRPSPVHVFSPMHRCGMAASPALH